jgi:hypothetical protein
MFPAHGSTSDDFGNPLLESIWLSLNRIQTHQRQLTTKPTGHPLFTIATSNSANLLNNEISRYFEVSLVVIFSYKMCLKLHLTCFNGSLGGNRYRTFNYTPAISSIEVCAWKYVAGAGSRSACVLRGLFRFHCGGYGFSRGSCS